MGLGWGKLYVTIVRIGPRHVTACRMNSEPQVAYGTVQINSSYIETLSDDRPPSRS